MTFLPARSAGRRRALTLMASLLGVLVLGSAGARAATFTRGFVDDVWFDAPSDG